MDVFLNNRFVPFAQAAVSVHDHGFLYGDGVYETLRAYNGSVFLLNEHLKRLQHSVDGIQLKLPMPLKRIGRMIQRTVATNRHKEAVVRLTVTRGPGPYGFDPRACRTPTLAIVSLPFKPYPAWYYKKGITAALVSVRRNHPLSLPPHVKSISCLNGILAKIESIKRKAQEGLFLTLDGHVAEGTVSNVFAVRQGRLFTPALEGSLLAGVTRAHVCRLAGQAGYPVAEKRMPVSFLLSAEEIFLTNTTLEIVPVTRLLVSRSLPQSLLKRTGGWSWRAPGPVTLDLRQRFRRSIVEMLNCAAL